MRKKNQIQQILSIFEQPGSYWLMVDLLKLYDEEVFGSILEEDQYLLYINKLKYRLEQQLATYSIPQVIQKTLEQEIEELKPKKDE